jgi:hypothetical protein
MRVREERVEESEVENRNKKNKYRQEQEQQTRPEEKRTNLWDLGMSPVDAQSFVMNELSLKLFHRSSGIPDVEEGNDHKTSNLCVGVDLAQL